MMEEGENVNMTTFGKKMKDQVERKGRIPVQPDIKKELKCFFFFFCKKRRHEKILLKI